MKDQRTWAPLTGLRPNRAVRVPMVDRGMTWVAEQFLLTSVTEDPGCGRAEKGDPSPASTTPGDRGDSPEQGLGALRDSGRACSLPRGRGVVSVPVDRQALPRGAR